MIVVNDIELAKKFYHDLFGLEVLLDSDGNVIMTEGLVPVSYTHLDVYKRQVSEIVGYIVYIFTEKPGETFFGWRLYAFGLAGIIMAVLLMRSRIPVSYTHLDVYKRQVWKRQ